jgi:UDP-N-acetylmuramyl pentapeptide phosphotransferase/UDP-N-acetylglucosamine-1-phosphate transferase
MGDSGSLIIGMFIYVLSTKLIEYPPERQDNFWVQVSNPIFAIAALIYPLTDTLRIFILRAVRGQSPFSADRNHIHHKLVDAGYSHANTVICIYIFSLVSVGLSLLSFYLKANITLAIIIACSVFFILWVNLAAKLKSKKR